MGVYDSLTPPPPKRRRRRSAGFPFRPSFKAQAYRASPKKTRPFEDWKFGPVEFGRRYGWHFPEMGKIVTENLAYAKAGKELERF